MFVFSEIWVFRSPSKLYQKAVYCNFLCEKSSSNPENFEHKRFLNKYKLPFAPKGKKVFWQSVIYTDFGPSNPSCPKWKNLLAVRFLAFKYLYNNRDFGFLYMLFLKKKVRNKNRTPTSAGPFCNVFVFILINEMYCILNNRRVKIL